MQKKLLSLAVSILMVFALIPQGAVAVMAEDEFSIDQIQEDEENMITEAEATDIEPDENEVPPEEVPEETQQPETESFFILSEEMSIPSMEAFDFTDEEAERLLAEEAKSFPVSFDMRNVDTDGDGTGDTSWITPVRLQNPYGSCWAFATMAAAESSLLSSGLAAEDGLDYQTLDLSERHLSVFSKTSIKDKNSSQYGEGYRDENMSASEIMNLGANGYTSSLLFANGLGPVLENNDPDLVYKGRNGWTDLRYIDGKLQPYCYSAADDWEIPYERRTEAGYSLVESYTLPSPAKADYNDSRGYDYNASGTNAIKSELLKGHAVHIAFLADQSSPKDEGNEPSMLSDDWAHYGAFEDECNHAVTIVGWDDTIGAEDSPVQFRNDNKPPADMFPDGRHEGATDGGCGAWLVKNSWGSGEREFPNKGLGKWGIENDEGVNTGYFWLSYYDKSLCFAESYQFENNDGLTVEAYDYLPALSANSKEYEEPVRMANVFTTDCSQHLEKIGIQTTRPATHVEWQIYLLSSTLVNVSSPEAGLLLSEGEADFEWGGIHKLILPKKLAFAKGQKYAIVVTETVKKDGKTQYTANLGIADKANYKGVINKEESFFFKDGSWNDMIDEDLQKEIGDPPNPPGALDEPEWAYDNFCIKGYYSPMESNYSMELFGNPNLKFVSKQDQATYKLRFSSYGGSLPEDMNISWNVDTNLFDKEELDGGYTAKVTAKRKDDGTPITGDSKLIVSVTDGSGNDMGTIYFDIYAYTVEITGVILKSPRQGVIPNKEILYTGSAIEPAVDVVAGPSTLPPECYDLEYSNNVKCGVAHVVATGKGDVGVVEGSNDLYYVIMPLPAVLEKAEAGEGCLTVTVKDQAETGISGYQINYREAGTEKWLSKEFEAGKTQYSVNGLTPGKKYEMQVCGFVDTSGKEDYGIEPKYYGDPSTIQTSEKILKLVQPMTVTAKTKTLKASVLKNSKKTVKCITVKKAEGTVTYKKDSVNLKKYKENFKVNKTTGKITVKKGTPKGTYKIKVRVNAAGNDHYNAGGKTVTAVINVK